jgi:hypothetical protein
VTSPRPSSYYAPFLEPSKHLPPVRAVALYGVEPWWDGQQDRKEDIQKQVSRRARVITGARALPTRYSARPGPSEYVKNPVCARQSPCSTTRDVNLRLLSTPSRGPDGGTLANPFSMYFNFTIGVRIHDHLRSWAFHNAPI